MSTRSATAHTRPPSQRPSALPGPAVPSNQSPRSGTPTRIHAPRARGHHHPSSSDMPPPASAAIDKSPSTPTRKRNTARKRADARKPLPADDGSEDADTPDEDLLELLGMTSSTQLPPNEKGVLSVTKAEIEAANGKQGSNKRGGRRNGGTSAVLNDAEGPVSSDADGPRRSRRNKKANDSVAITERDDQTSRSSSNRRSKAAAQTVAARDDAQGSNFDVTSLSKSLPHSFHSETIKRSQNDPAWDMPVEATGGQPLNWQQQLVAGDKDSASRRSQRAPTNAPGVRKSKRQQVKTEGHDRRASHDITPTSNLTTMLKATEQKVNVPVSAFDSSIPFHTGYNVHRAPQTPIRHGGHHSPADFSDHNGAISLPIVGEFPRLNKAGGTVLGVNKYAGPTFHNSPASGSLPAPDLDDF